MIIELRKLYQVEGESKLIEYTIGKEELSEYKGLEFVTPIAVNGEVSNKTGIVALSMTVSFTLKHNCDRCLCEFLREYSYSFKHILIERLENEEDVFDEYIETGDEGFNLDELVLSDLQLQLPTKILCREGCKGLCSICGADLNMSECNCIK